MEIKDFTRKLSVNDTDLMLIQDGTDNLFKSITRGNLLANLTNNNNGTNSYWQIVNNAVNARHGDKLLIDTSIANWTISLPPIPDIGTEINLYTLNTLNTNILTIDTQGNKYKSAIPKKLTCNKNYSYTKLIYIDSNIGWIDTNNIFNASGTYSEEVLKDNPYVYLRLNDVSGVKALDSSINNRDCTYEGTVAYQQEGSLISDTNNKSIGFNGSNTRIIINPQTTAPSIYALECRFKTTNLSGQLFCFLLGGNNDRDLYLDNGKLRYFNYTGADIITPLTYNDNKWHTVTACTCSRGAEIYVDGELVVSSNNKTTYSYSANWNIGYGMRSGYFNGLIDEVSITHSELSVERIKERHTAAISY